MIKTTKIFAFLFAALLFVGCQSQNSEIETNTQDTADTQEGANTQEPIDTSSEEVPEVSEEYQTEYDVDMTDFAYSVTQIQAKPGDTITINLTNSEGTHDLVIDELDLHSEHLDEGQTETMTIVIPEDVEPGTEYEYYCSVGNHRELGMVGTLTIIE